MAYRRYTRRTRRVGRSYGRRRTTRRRRTARRSSSQRIVIQVVGGPGGQVPLSVSGTKGKRTIRSRF